MEQLHQGVFLETAFSVTGFILVSMVVIAYKLTVGASLSLLMVTPYGRLSVRGKSAILQ